MIQVKVIKASRKLKLEKEINDALQALKAYNIVDIKFSGAYDGTQDMYTAVIMYK